MLSDCLSHIHTMAAEFKFPKHSVLCFLLAFHGPFALQLGSPVSVP